LRIEFLIRISSGILTSTFCYEIVFEMLGLLIVSMRGIQRAIARMPPIIVGEEIGISSLQYVWARVDWSGIDRDDPVVLFEAQESEDHEFELNFGIRRKVSMILCEFVFQAVN
jgi:Na+-transporting methylmalonyl-CoA/oxaloacetate decarboxylase gamma subunit